MILSDARLAVLVPHLYEGVPLLQAAAAAGCRNGLLDGGWPAISPLVRPGWAGRRVQIARVGEYRPSWSQ
jgi:hypothetical protein